jgi:hypothetical protein
LADESARKAPHVLAINRSSRAVFFRLFHRAGSSQKPSFSFALELSFDAMVTGD